MARTKSIARKKKSSVTGKKALVGGGTKKRKPHRFRPGTVARREIKRYQKDNNFLILKTPFERLVREIAKKYNPSIRFSSLFFSALQEAAEAYMVNFFEQADLIRRTRDKETVSKIDIQTVRRLNTIQQGGAASMFMFDPEFKAIADQHARDIADQRPSQMVTVKDSEKDQKKKKKTKKKKTDKKEQTQTQKKKTTAAPSPPVGNEEEEGDLSSQQAETNTSSSEAQDDMTVDEPQNQVKESSDVSSDVSK